MFQFKNTGLGVKEPDTSAAMPNAFGKVRTFKEDSENFGKGIPDKDTLEGKDILPLPAEKSPEKNSLKKPEPPQSIPAVSSVEQAPQNPFQSVPTPPPASFQPSGLPAFKSAPSQSFFQEKPSPKENILPDHMENQGGPPSTTKNKSKLGLLLMLLVIIAAAGAGFYYYWFYFRNNSPATSGAPAGQTVPTSTSTAPSDSQNKNIRRLVTDTSQGQAEVKNAVQKFTSEFASSAAENDLVEIKIIGKDNQLIKKKDFIASFGSPVPDAVLMKLSEDYSLFAKKEGGGVKLGLAFKTVTSSGLADEMKNWEPTTIKDLGSLYVGQAPSGTGSFNPSQYKNADIRYFNFSSPADTSLDYSVISNFLIIGTSKDSMRSILDYMSEK